MYAILPMTVLKAFSIQISLKFVPEGRIGTIPTLVQIMVLRRAFIWTNDGLIYWRIYVSLGLDELSPSGQHFMNI